MFKPVVQDAHSCPISGLPLIISLSHSEYCLTLYLCLVSLLWIRGKMLAVYDMMVRVLGTTKSCPAFPPLPQGQNRNHSTSLVISKLAPILLTASLFCDI